MSSPRGRLMTRLACLLCCAQLAICASAKEPAQIIPPADTSSPRETLRSFLEGCNDIYDTIQERGYVDREDPTFRPMAMRVMDCLDTSQLAAFARVHAGAEAALCIKEILDRVEVPPYDEIPGDEEVDASGGLERWRVPGTRLVIVKIAEGPRKHEYLFSAGTIARSFQYFEDLQSVPYRTGGPETSPGFHHWYVTAPANKHVAAVVDKLPEAMRARFLDVAWWKWIGVALATLFCLGLMALCYWLQRLVSVRFGADKPVLHFLTLVFPALAVAVPYLYRWIATYALAIRGDWIYRLSFGASVVTLLAAVVLVTALIHRIASLLIAMPHINPRGLDAQVIRILSRILGLSAAVIVLLEGGQHLGIPLTTLLASAGVGGLAVALAAQDTLRNLFGTIMLMADKPFRIGERIVANDYDGVVEDIGLRSTRIRLLTGHLVTVPNDTLAKIDIENIGRRPYIRRVTDLHVPLDTPRATIEGIVHSIREELADHEGLNPEYPPRVFFAEFDAEAFLIRVMYWFHPADYWGFCDFSERVNLRIVETLESYGVSLTRPMRLNQGAGDAVEEALRVEVIAEESRDESSGHGSPR